MLGLLLSSASSFSWSSSVSNCWRASSLAAISRTGPPPSGSGVLAHSQGHLLFCPPYYTVLFSFYLRNCAIITLDIHWRNGRGKRGEIKGIEAAKGVDF